MQAIVTAIDGEAGEELATIWGELKAVFGLSQLTGATRPYVTFTVAERFAHGIENVLSEIASKGTPFALKTHGIGITEGQQTVIYLHVDRTEILDDVHHVIHHATQRYARNPKPAYDSETWLPHIALATGPLSPAEIEQIMPFLNRRAYDYAFPATNLCLIRDTRIIGAEWQRFDLKGIPTTTEKGPPEGDPNH